MSSSLKALIDSILLDFFRFNPTMATNAGQHDFDAFWPDISNEGHHACEIYLILINLFHYYWEWWRAWRLSFVTLAPRCPSSQPYSPSHPIYLEDK